MTTSVPNVFATQPAGNVLASKLDANFNALVSGVNGSVQPGPATTSGLTTPTLTLLGRSTAGTGALEAITIGANLTLAAGVLSASGGGGLTVGTTSVTSGTTTRVLFDNAGTLGEYAISGSGSVVMTSNAVLITPALGTPSSGVLSSCTGYATANLTGAAAGVLTFLATPSSANLLSALTTKTGTGLNVFDTSPTLITPLLGTPTSGNLQNCTADGTNAVGFRQIPQNSQSAAYTTVLADGGKHLYHPSADTTARVWTIDSNANVAYPIGTAITFVNDTSGGVITIAITADTLVLAGAGTTGSRTLAANGVATAVKMTSTRWIISGTGLT